jgi:lipopolysaccharide heptosyltransferase I
MAVLVPENILIIKPSSLGDVVHALPVLAKLSKTFPESKISWLVGTAAAPLVERNPRLDRIYLFRRGKGELTAAIALAKRLRKARFDCVVDLQGLLRSALFAFATGAPRRIGLSDAREGATHFYTDVVKVEDKMHAVDRYLAVGEALGFDAKEPVFSIDAGDEAQASIERMLGAGDEPLPQPYVVLSLGARWRSKVYPAKNFLEAARLIRERFGGTVFLVGTRSEAGAAGKVVEEGLGEGVVNLVGRTSLSEAVALFSRADFVLTGDTGLLHVADALGVPLVAVFGPTDPELTGPYFQRSRVLVENICGAAPCMKRDCEGECCRAMKAVSPEAVFEKAVEVLEATL